MESTRMPEIVIRNPYQFATIKRKIQNRVIIMQLAPSQRVGNMSCAGIFRNCCSAEPKLLAAHRSYMKRLSKRNRGFSVLNQAIDDVLKESAPSKGAEVPAGLNKFSKRITQPKSQGASQAMLYGTGLRPDDMDKPQVRRCGGSIWLEGVAACDTVHAHWLLADFHAGETLMLF